MKYQAVCISPFRVELMLIESNIPCKIYRYNPKVWEAGIEEREIGDRKIKIYNLARTIADCFKFATK